MDIEQLNRIGQAAKDYYRQIDHLTPNKQDFEEWLLSLKEPMQSDFRKGVLNFQRLCLEMHDFGMDAFMKAHLSPEDFKAWAANE
jgi:hypothetical protein